MGTAGRIANGISNDLITRAADVILKEKRNLILVPRETPFNLIHLRNLTTLAEAGATIIPASPSFYSKPESIDDAVNTVVDKVLTLSGFNNDGFVWGE
jgi:4-hydroxy-3-polyprenylbenzoate decarboxylase